jgi:predicted nucleic acid-binding protein
MPAENPPILIDSSVWIAGQRDPQRFRELIAAKNDLATCDAAVGEFRVGLFAPREKATREQVREFFEASVEPLARYPHFPEDFAEAARLIGEAIFASKAKPSFPDGLIAAVARRTGRVVWTRDETDFKAMGCRVENPFSEHPPAQ